MHHEDQAIHLLRAEQRGLEIAEEIVRRTVGRAKILHTETDYTTASSGDEIITRIDEAKASIEREVKRIQRRTKREADEMRAKL